jgi:hypothetical protein
VGLSRLHGLLLKFGGIAIDRNITAYCITIKATNRNHILYFVMMLREIVAVTR